MDFVTIMLSLLIGGLTGFFSGFLGVGGGFILVPLLIFINVPAHYAIGGSLAYIVFVGIFGAIQHHHRHKDCDFKIVLPMILGGIVTAQFGSIATLFFKAEDLGIMLAVILMCASIIMVVSKNRTELDGEGVVGSVGYSRNIPMAVFIGLVVGLISGFFGVGGGFILIPMMTTLLKMPIRTAVGTSLLAVAGFAVSGTIGHLMLDHIDPYFVGLLVIGGIIASPLGVMATEKVSSKHLREIFAVVLILFAIKLLIPS
ncbi:MAG: uncharacterized protein QG670_159 [Thermoproteota archaeon]|nr:uncharacterized protein [Thermoproteota archaeon]